MDHGQYQHKQCLHGRCLNHDPQFQDVGKPRLVPAPAFFGLIAVELTEWCCGRPMLRLRKIQERACQKCGRKITIDVAERLECRCCGYHREAKELFPNILAALAMMGGSF